MQLNAAQIRDLLPHTGAMCLLECVVECTADTILCSTRTHLLATHPLRSALGLGSAIAIEYAAQAMALHAGLQLPTHPTLDAGPSHGVLASVRRVALNRPYLDDTDADLMVRATVLSCDAMSALYSFEVSAQGQEIAAGRSAVIFAMATQDNLALSPIHSGERS